MGYQRDKLKGKKIKKYNLLEKLGSGSYGTVYKAVNTKTDEILAIKVLSKTQMKQIPKLQQLVKTEIQILQQINNQNVIKFVDSFSSGDNVFIVTEFCNGGDLEQYCKKKGKLAESQAVNYLKQILNGFRGLHENNTMHRDFKLANVLLHNHVCKIADLGFAKKLKDRALTLTQLGTDETMAPQVHEGNRYGWGADIWSIGVVFYQMLYDRLPYSGMNDWAILKNIKTTIPKYEDVDVSSQAISFIQRCLVYDPKQRIQWKQIYEHPLLYKSDITLTTANLRCSKLDFSRHKTYYEKNQQQKCKTLHYGQDIEELTQTKKKQKDMFENAGDMKNADSQADNIRKRKQDLQVEFAKYEEMIISKRNDVMLGLTFILPLEKELVNISVPHSKALYEICKQTYIELKILREDVTQYGNPKSSYKGLTYWKDFKEQPIFKTLCDQLFEDELFAQSLAISYRVDSGQTDNLNRTTHTSNIKDVLSSYRKELTPFLKKLPKKTKIKFIKMLKALQIIEDNSDKNFIKFTQDTQNFNLQKEEKYLLSNL